MSDGTAAYYFHIRWAYQLLQYRAHPLSFTSSCLWTLWIHTGEFKLKLFYFWAAMKRRHTGCLTKPARLKVAVNTGRLPDWMGWLVDVLCVSSSIRSVLLHITTALAPCGWAAKSEQPTLINARLAHVVSFLISRLLCFVLFILVAPVMQRSSAQSPCKLRRLHHSCEVVSHQRADVSEWNSNCNIKSFWAIKQDYVDTVH